MESLGFKKKKISQLYSDCLGGIPMMTTLQSKKFILKLAFKINELNEKEKISQKKYSQVETQTDLFEQLEQKKGPLLSTQSLRKLQQFGQISQKDQLLQQTIQKYEKLIESLYEQIEVIQQENEQKFTKMQRQYEIKIKEAERRCKSGKMQSCTCPIDDMQKQIKRLEGEIKKRDKDLIKRLHNKI